jgi:hypothetical protein
MPNNSNARQKQKKQGRKKKTDPPPLHKEDKASVDSIPRPLSLSGKDDGTMDWDSPPTPHSFDLFLFNIINVMIG